MRRKDDVWASTRAVGVRDQTRHGLNGLRWSDAEGRKGQEKIWRKEERRKGEEVDAEGQQTMTSSRVELVCVCQW